MLHEELIREIDEKIGQMLKKLQNENRPKILPRRSMSIWCLAGSLQQSFNISSITFFHVGHSFRASPGNITAVGRFPGKMRSPVKIGEALFVETHYDTETLLRILTTRILDEVMPVPMFNG